MSSPAARPGVAARRGNIVDAAFAALLVLFAGVCLLMSAATLVDHLRSPSWSSAIDNPEPLVFLLAYLALAVATLMARRALRRGGIARRGYLALLACTAVAFYVALRWFRDPMHDIALAFGSHGRWGCPLVGDDGEPIYFVRDSTMPWLLFGPLAVATLGHRAYSQRRGRPLTTAVPPV